MLQVDDSINNYCKENIINYERRLIESPFQSLPKPTSRNQSKYSVCEVNQKIQQIINDSPYNLRWIGNSKGSHIDAYMYCLLMLSITSNRALLMFKNAFYQLCRKYLDVKEQKLLIEFLCLLQFSSDKFLFLKKYPSIELIIFSVFDKLQAEENYFSDDQTEESKTNQDVNPIGSFRQSRSNHLQIEDSATGQLFRMNSLAQTYSKFAVKFHFLKWSKSSEHSFVFTIQENKKMHILVEKEYFFILQPLETIQVKPTKSKLSKGDRIQVQRLLSSSQTQSQMNFTQKLNYLSQCTTKKPSQKKQPESFTFKKTEQFENPFQKKEISSINIKSCDSQNSFKKDFKLSYFVKKPSSKLQQVNEIIQNEKITTDKKQDYIDLMQSSFQQEGNQNSEKDQTKKTYETTAIKFYKPKFIPKPLNPPSDIKNKKKLSVDKVNRTEVVVTRSRSPSEVNKKSMIPNNLIQKEKKRLKSKQMKFYSPPKFLNESPEKKQMRLKNQEATLKKQPDIAIKQKKKEDFRLFDKKYYQKKEQIHKNHVNDHNNTKDVFKASSSFAYNPKIFNNRISLQSRKDLQMLAKYKIPTPELTLNKIPQVNKSQEVSKRQFLEKKKQIREQLSQSLNNKSEIQLKKRLFEHLGNKLTGQNLKLLPNGEQKHSKSVEPLENLAQKGTIEKSSLMIVDGHKKNDSNFQCPQNSNVTKFQGQFQIRVRYAEHETAVKNQ